MLQIIRRAADIAFDGNVAALAVAIGAPRPSLYFWQRRVPAEYVLKLEAATKRKLKRSDIRPDLYPPRRKA